MQENAKPGSVQLNLKGILVGDGWVNPRIQATKYAPLAFATGLIDDVQLSQIQEVDKICETLIDAEKYAEANDKCNQLDLVQQFSGNIQPEDIR